MAAETMRRGGSKIAENTLSLVVSAAAALVFTVAQLGVLSRFLSEEQFGLFVALRGFSFLLATLILVGLPQVLVRYLPSYQTRGTRGRAFVLFFGSVAAVIVLGLVLLFGIDWWRGLMPERIGVLLRSDGVIFWLMLASLALALKLLLYGGFSGLREMRMQMLLETIDLFALTVYIVAHRTALGVEGLFRVIFIINAAIVIIGVPLFVRLGRNLIADGRSAEGEMAVLPPFAPYWGGSIALSFVALAFTDVDRFVMSSVLPVAAVSLFHVASRINGLLKRFIGMPVIAAQPEITRIFEEGRWGELAGKIRLFTKGIFVASILTAGLVAAIGRHLLEALSGESYGAAYPVLLLLLPTIPLSAIVAPLVITMRSLHFMHWAVLCDFLWMAGYFGTFYPFVAMWGVAGMAAAQIAATLMQMSAAILLARREGFYGGIGGRIGTSLAVVAPAVVLCVLATSRFGIGASILCVAFFPFACKLFVKRLAFFDGAEKRQIAALVPIRWGRSVAAWLLSMEE